MYRRVHLSRVLGAKAGDVMWCMECDQEMFDCQCDNADDRLVEALVGEDPTANIKKVKKEED